MKTEEIIEELFNNLGDSYIELLSEEQKMDIYLSNDTSSFIGRDIMNASSAEYCINSKYIDMSNQIKDEINTQDISKTIKYLLKGIIRIKYPNNCNLNSIETTLKQKINIIESIIKMLQEYDSITRTDLMLLYGKVNDFYKKIFNFEDVEDM